MISNSQVNKNAILLTIDRDSVSASEFIRVYKKNLDLVKKESQKDIDTYLDLFIKYKLKIAEARTLNYDKKKTFIKELNGYRNQLSKNYLTDHKVTEKLLQEAYNRLAYDIKASHVLVAIPEEEQDTIQAYLDITKLRERFANEDFNTLRSQAHNGSTVFVEDLGYFTAFKMVYDFENIVYNTKVGEVSQPFRTQFGYHAVKVLDKRKSRGEITIGHIVIRENNLGTLPNAEQRINEIYKLLKQGSTFEDLAKQFSEDKNTASKGGKLAPIKSGQLRSVVFENEAFSLNNVGDISKPFKGEFGWHIIKLYNKKSFESYEELKQQIETQIKRDERSKYVDIALVGKLLNLYGVSYENLKVQDFVFNLTSSVQIDEWDLPLSSSDNKLLFKLKNKEYRYNNFIEFLNNSTIKNTRGKELIEFLKNQFKLFVDKSLLEYYEQNLEVENSDFAATIKEFEEGLLLFELMDNKVWKAAQKDSIGLKQLYNNNAPNYVVEEQIKASIATASNEKTIKKVRKLWAKNQNVNILLKKINKNNVQNVIITNDVITKNHQLLPDNFEFKEGISKIIFHNNNYHAIKVNTILPERIKTFDEARGELISDYQNQKEKELLDLLLTKYKVIINTDVLNAIKSQL